MRKVQQASAAKKQREITRCRVFKRGERERERERGGEGEEERG